MKYVVMYAWRNMPYLDAPSKKFDNAEEAYRYANQFNTHIWKFHQHETGNKYYYVKEVQ